MNPDPRIGTNSGHGHAWERPDGLKARCGGPGFCRECAGDLMMLAAARKGDEKVGSYYGGEPPA